MGMEVKKQLKTVESILGFCSSKDWIQKSSLFPAYIDLDGDQGLQDEEISNPLHALKEQKTDIEDKLELLQASDKPIREEFKVIDEEGNIDFERMTKINSKDQSSHAINIRVIAEGLSKLLVLDKSLMKRDFRQMDDDRTVYLHPADVENLQVCLQASRALDETRFTSLAVYRTLESQHSKLELLHSETKYEL